MSPRERVGDIISETGPSAEERLEAWYRVNARASGAVYIDFYDWPGFVALVVEIVLAAKRSAHLEDARAGLTFAELRAVNVPRCINDFGHTLESWSPAEWTNAMCGEAGEAANVAKKILRHRDGVAGNVGEDKDLAGLKVKLVKELADVVIYADLCAAAQGMDLAQAIVEKFNEVSVRVGSPLRLRPEVWDALSLPPGGQK